MNISARSATRTLRATARRRPRLLAVLATAMIMGLQVVLGAPAAVADSDCARPPTVEVANGGLVGVIDPSIGQGIAEPPSPYYLYGYSGQRWHVYDVGTRILGCQDTSANINTWIGNLMLDGGKVIVAAHNGLYYGVITGGIGDRLDELVRQGSMASFDGFAVPFLPIALLLVGIAVFRYVFSGKNAGAAKSGVRVLAGLGLIAATALSPLTYSYLFDDLILSSAHDVQAKMQKQMYGEGMPQRDTPPTKMHTYVVYENWVRGEFGDPHTILAANLGPRLLADQACNWTELHHTGCDPNAKREDFKKVAEEVKAKGNYAAFTGESGRPGSGLAALYEGVVMGLFPLICKAAVLIGQLLMRALVLFGPIVGMLCFLPEVGRRVGRTIGTVLVLSIALSAVAELHTFMEIKVIESNMAFGFQLIVMTLLTMLVWGVTRPVKRLRQMVTAALHLTPGGSPLAHSLTKAAQTWHQQRWMRRLYKGNKKRHFDREWWLGPEPGYPSWPHEETGPAPIRAEASRASGFDATRPGIRGNVVHGLAAGRTNGDPGATGNNRPGGTPPREPGGGGAGTAARGPIRVPEAVRVDREHPDRPDQDPGQRPGIQGTPSRRELPAGTGRSEATTSEASDGILGDGAGEDD
ncbi:hypothetical protein, partial [Amycolatopsis sp. NPDC058986]